MELLHSLTVGYKQSCGLISTIFRCLNVRVWGLEAFYIVGFSNFGYTLLAFRYFFLNSSRFQLIALFLLQLDRHRMLSTISLKIRFVQKLSLLAQTHLSIIENRNTPFFISPSHHTSVVNFPNFHSGSP